jgi:serine/threonine protein kinase
MLKLIESGDVEAYLNSPPMIVMEFMEGGSFMDLIQNPQITNSVFWRKIVYKVILQTASGLKYMHSLGYVHLDVKPQNIFFPQKMGNTGESVYKSLKVKLGDLGVGLSLRFHEFVFNLSSSFPLVRLPMPSTGAVVKPLPSRT